MRRDDADRDRCPGRRARPPTVRAGGSLARDESAVSEVVGFILMFAMAFLILGLTMVLVSSRLDDTSKETQRSAFAEAGAKVRSTIQEAVVFADLFPNSTFERRVRMPPALDGVSYNMTVTERAVYVNRTTASLSVRFGGFDLDAEGINFTKTSLRAQAVRVTYQLVTPPSEPAFKLLTVEVAPP